MRWRYVHGDAVGAPWRYLERDLAPSPGAPELHLEACRGRMMRLMLGARPLLWARIAADYYGYWYVRPEAMLGPVPLLPHISAAATRAASQAERGSSVWFADWARFFAAQLDEAATKLLYPGRWQLGPAKLQPTAGWPDDFPPTGSLSELPEQPRHSYMAWDFETSPLVLRAASPLHDGRIKALRKQARDGELAPLVLLWMSGLQNYVLLDGHDRLQAALLEGAVPHALALVRVTLQPYPLTAARRAEAERVAAALQVNASLGKAAKLDTGNRVLIDAYNDRPYERARSYAWPLGGGCEQWRREVSAQLASVADADRAMLTEPDRRPR